MDYLLEDGVWPLCGLCRWLEHHLPAHRTLEQSHQDLDLSGPKENFKGCVAIHHCAARAKCLYVGAQFPRVGSHSEQTWLEGGVCVQWGKAAVILLRGTLGHPSLGLIRLIGSEAGLF